MRIVLDTNVYVSALLVGGSAGAAPRQVLRLCLKGAAVPLMGTAPHAADEDMLARTELFARSPLPPAEREAVFDALMSACQWTLVYCLWRPNLPDADDDHVVELAVAGAADWIVTANVRDPGRGEVCFDHLAIGTAGDFVDRHNDLDQEKIP